MPGLLGEAFSEAGKLNELVDVWRNPISPSTGEAEGSVKAEGKPMDDQEMKNIEVNNADVMDDEGNGEENGGDGQEDVPPVPEAEGEEARRPAMRRAPREPTRQEIDEHNLTHLPFRSWCPCCVAAKAKHWPHRRSGAEDGAEEAVPSIRMDYWFMRDDEVDENVTVINHKEKIAKAYGAHVVKKKGAESGVAERIIKHVEKWGSKGELIVKTDQEPSIQAVAEEMRRLRSEETIIEASKKYDSQSNGIAERAVQTVEGQVRAMLLRWRGDLMQRCR